MWVVDWQKIGIYLAILCGVLAVVFYHYPRPAPTPLPPKEIVVEVPEPEPPPKPPVKIPLKPKPNYPKHPYQSLPMCDRVPPQAYQYPPSVVIRYAQSMGISAEDMKILRTCIGL